MLNKKSFSWWLIVLMFVVFFPIAICMIIRKMTVEKLNYAQNGEVLKNLGIALLCLAGLYLFIGLIDGFPRTEDGSSIIGGVILFELVFGGCGVLCVVKGNEYITRGIKYRRYVAIINASNDLLVDNIAAAVPTTYDEAVNDIQQMLDDGFFVNAYLDLGKRELVMPMVSGEPNTAVDVVNLNGSTDRNITNKPYSIKCPNCGATNTVISGVKCECEYCSSLLQDT